jgi:hypothetical protein
MTSYKSAYVGNVRRLARSRHGQFSISYMNRIKGGKTGGRIDGPFVVDGPARAVDKLREHKPGAKKLIAIYQEDGEGKVKRFLDFHY